MRNGNFGFILSGGCCLIHGGWLFDARHAQANSAQPAEEPVLGETDMNVTQEDLDAQLAELHGIMSRMGLGNKAPDSAEAGRSAPPRGFVQSTFMIEGWEPLLPPLPDTVGGGG